MAKVNSLLTQRLKMATQKLSKMTNLVEMSSNGNLSSFTGVFRVGALTEKEKQTLHELLDQYKNESQEIELDLKQLTDITAEVKAINNQAIILHGERIKKAQSILKNYRDGAFSAWLVATYGNRQTPYNFLQYYELYTTIPEGLHAKLDEMPRQAVYSLASRNGDLEHKHKIISEYQGQPKQELLNLIRDTFPLSEDDKRAYNSCDAAILSLRRLHHQVKTHPFRPTTQQLSTLRKLLKEIQKAVESGHE